MTDPIELWLSALEVDLGKCKNSCASCITNISRLMALVRLYREANRNELRRCGGTVPILKEAAQKALEIISPPAARELRGGD